VIPTVELAVIFRFDVPIAAWLFAVNVRIVLPLPGNGMEPIWEVTAGGVQQTESETGSEKPPTAVLVTVALAVLP
jgi:hypothetical protein